VRSAPLVAVVLTGCNTVYGLDETIPLDARLFDAPPDAAPMCPGPGGEPKFRAGYTQLPVQDCDSYIPTRAWGKAVAYCPLLNIAVGDTDKELAPATVVPASDRYRFPRVSDDGLLMFVENAQSGMLDIFRRTDETWSYTRSIFDASYRFASNPTTPKNGEARHAIQSDFRLNQNYVVELEEQADAWPEVAAYPASELGVGVLDQPALSSDGLNLTFIGSPLGGMQQYVFYAERVRTTDHFANAARLTTVPLLPGIGTPFITDDCGRFYFSALRTVFYQVQ